MKRPHMPLGVKLAACLIQMGFHPADAARAAGIKLPKSPEGALAWSAARLDERPRARIDFDHCPALGLRRLGFEDWTPGANDPRWIEARAQAPHAVKTKDDTTRAAKVKRLVKKQAPKEWCEKCKSPSPCSRVDCQFPRWKPALKRKRAWPKGRKIASRAK